MFGDGSFLNGQYTVFGKVVAGMQFVDNIKKGDQANNGTVTDPDKIVSAKIEYEWSVIGKWPAAFADRNALQEE